jgi:hypothetical protein
MRVLNKRFILISRVDVRGVQIYNDKNSYYLVVLMY